MQKRLPGPAIATNRLRAQLIKYRESAGLLQADVMKQLDWSASKIHRVENGPTRVQTGDVMLLLQVYGVTDREERDAMIDLARASRLPGISTRYKSVFSSDFVEYLDYEAFANHVSSYQTKFIPGVLQIGGYAEAVNRTVTRDEEEIILRTDARNERAQNLLSPDGPKLEFILDEATLHRAIGSTDAPWDLRYETMSRLIDNLKTLNTVVLADGPDSRTNPRISIQVVPLEWDVYPAYNGPFVVLDFDEPDDRSLLYLEHPASENLIFDENAVQDYRDTFDELRRSVPGPEKTTQLLDYIKESYVQRLQHSPLRPIE